MTAGSLSEAEARAQAARVPDVVALDGPGADVAARVLGLFAADREARLALARERRAYGTPRIWAGAALGVLGVGSLLVGFPVGLVWLIFGGWLLMAGGDARSEGDFYAATLGFALDAQALLAAFLPELHPDGRAELRLAGERRFGALTAVGADRDGRAEVAFWGTFPGPPELVAALRDLGRAIAAEPA